MADTATMLTAFAGLTVAVGALLVSVGVFFLVMKIGGAIEAMGKSSDKE